MTGPSYIARVIHKIIGNVKFAAHRPRPKQTSPGAIPYFASVKVEPQPDFYIQAFITKTGFKNEPAAANNISIMAQGIMEKGRFLSEILPRLAEIIHSQRRDPDDSFARLATLGEYFDTAGENVTASYSHISKNILKKDKFYLYATICQNPDAFYNLFNHRLFTIASGLKYIAKYACRLLLFSMFELPELTAQLTQLAVREAEIREVEGEVQLVYKDEKIPERRKGQMRKAIVAGLKEVGGRLESDPIYQKLSREEKAEKLFVEQVRFLKKYSHLGLVRIACVYLRDFFDQEPAGNRVLRDRMFEAAAKNMQLIYNEMSNLSDVLLGHAYSVAERRTYAAFGHPLKEFIPPQNDQIPRGELEAANRLLRRGEDHKARRALVAAYGSSDDYYGRINALVLAFKDDFGQRILGNADNGRSAFNLTVAGRLKAALSEKEKASFLEVFGSMENVAESLAHYLFGFYRYLRTSRFALLLGGANARNEFPSFDYDAFFMYEAEGKTTAGESNRQYFLALKQNLERAVFEMDHSIDNIFSPFPEGIGTLAEHLGHFQERKLGSYLNARAFSALSHGAGDRYFSARAIEQIYNFVYHPESVPVLVYIRLFQHRESQNARYDYEDINNLKDTAINIKYHPGGLRDIAYLFWVYKLLRGNQERDVFKVLKQIGAENIIAPAEMDTLIEAYKFMMNVRIRLDLYIGRNNKNIPEKEELENFSISLGYQSGREFENELLSRRGQITALTRKVIDSLAGGREIEQIVDRLFGKHTVDDSLRIDEIY